MIIDVRFSTEDSFATVGVKHYKFWTYANGKCTGDKGNFGPKDNNKLAGIAVNGQDIICGAADGSIQIWKGKGLLKSLPMKHEGVMNGD